MTAIISGLLGSRTRTMTLRDLKHEESMPEETGGSFSEIAVAKARWASNVFGLPAIGDDSGLCVDALDGAPGIKSRRWAPGADADRNKSLICALTGHKTPWDASFVSCVAYCSPGGIAVSALGECRGTIISSPRGDKGFGYDPIFELIVNGLTLADLTEEQKNRLSHRAVAVQNLFRELRWPTTEFTGNDNRVE